MQQKFLNAALDMGFTLCRDAIWHEGQCNWITMAYDIENDPGAYFCSLEPDFYSGTAGISYFLMSLYELTQEKIFHKTALGAISQAIFNTNKLEANYKMSFYRGLFGILHTLVYIDKNSSTSKLTANNIIAEISSNNLNITMNDIIDGCASAITSLGKIGQSLSDPKLEILLTALGTQLLKRAEKKENGWSWSSRAETDKNLLGYSHGTAGIAHALLELYNITKDEKYRHAAYEAVRYENHFFNPDVQNWPDFRSANASNEVSYACAWCHGAPGIGLSRLRAYEITGNENFRKDAEVAVGTTKKHILEALKHDSDFSLCHGVAGNTDLLIEASLVFKDEELMNTARQIGMEGIKKYFEPGLPYVNGIGNTYQIPDFMLGMAGIGYFYLRLYDPVKFPSMLLLHPNRDM